MFNLKKFLGLFENETKLNLKEKVSRFNQYILEEGWRILYNVIKIRKNIILNYSVISEF